MSQAGIQLNLPKLQEEWPLLVIVPAAMRLVWAEELEKWLPGVRPSRIHVIESKADRLQVGFAKTLCLKPLVRHKYQHFR